LTVDDLIDRRARRPSIIQICPECNPRKAKTGMLITWV
jgi:hypothetical protein